MTESHFIVTSTGNSADKETESVKVELWTRGTLGSDVKLGESFIPLEEVGDFIPLERYFGEPDRCACAFLKFYAADLSYLSQQMFRAGREK